MNTAAHLKPIKRVIKPVKVDANKRVIPKGSLVKPAYWRVNVGKKLTGTRKQRRFFSTEREAQDFLADLQDGLKKKGTSAFVIEDALAHEALSLVEELKPHQVGLTEAVRFFLKHAPKQKGVKVKDVIPAYLEAKSDVDYRRAQEISLNRFAAEFGNKLVAGVFPDAVRKWFKKQGWKPLNQRNYMRDISMFFKWCKLNDYCTVSPMEIRRRLHTMMPIIISPIRISTDRCFLHKSPSPHPYSTSAWLIQRRYIG
ncbi:MAG: hypothetical protein LV480_03775 [Methylacidiphilales bacterium]|nr:hypothetical protein [Candidatus Methylacidiphilales bacterium]